MDSWRERWGKEEEEEEVEQSKGVQIPAKREPEDSGHKIGMARWLLLAAGRNAASSTVGIAMKSADR